MGQETVKNKGMKNYLLPEDGRFRAETVYLSILPKLYPDTKQKLSDEEKAADYRMNYSELPMITLKEFTEPDSWMRAKLRAIKRETDFQAKVKKIMTQVPAAIIPARVKSRSDIERIEENMQGYNSIIALEVPIATDETRIFNLLKTKPWVWFAGRSIDEQNIIAIVPLQNKDFKKHSAVYLHIKEELKKDGIDITERCASLSMIVFQTYDAEAWRNDNCCLYRTQDHCYK